MLGPSSTSRSTSAISELPLFIGVVFVLSALRRLAIEVPARAGAPIEEPVTVADFNLR